MTVLSNYSLSFDYAGFAKRCVAAVIDLFVIHLGMTIVYMLAGVDTSAQEEGLRMLVLWIGISWFYFAAMESSPKRGTLGKIAMEIIVADADGNPVSFGRASVRYFGKCLSLFILGIGFFMVAFTARKQALHDIIAGCLVIKDTQQV